MRKFFKDVLLFLIPLLSLLLCLEYKLYKIPNSYNTKRANLESQINDIEVLVAGASHAYNGIDPQYFSHKGFNLANVSQSLFYDTRLVNKYAPLMPKLKLVIFDLSYSSFHFQVSNTKEEWRNFFYSRFWNINCKDLSRTDARCYTMMALYSPKETIKYIKKRFKVDLAAGQAKDGYFFTDSINISTQINDSVGKARAMLHTINLSNLNKETLQSITDNISDLEEAIKKLKERNIEVAFTTLPCYHTYYNYCDSRLLAFNDSVIHALGNKYNCSYYDRFKDTAFTILHFSDNDHLNSRGARIFSAQLDSAVIIPAFRKVAGNR